MLSPHELGAIFPVSTGNDLGVLSRNQAAGIGIVTFFPRTVSFLLTVSGIPARIHGGSVSSSGFERRDKVNLALALGMIAHKENSSRGKQDTTIGLSS